MEPAGEQPIAEDCSWPPGSVRGGVRKLTLSTTALPAKVSLRQPRGNPVTAITGLSWSAQNFPSWAALDDWYTVANLDSALARPRHQLTVATGSFLAFCLVDLAPEASTRCSVSMKLIAHPLGGEALEDCLASWVQDQGRAPWAAGCILSASRTRAIRSSNRARSCGESMVRSASSAIH